ncbi:MAG: SMC family ATPase [Candidatus Micrarchaeota archaeon]|nr:SMC family ATPase [Candidatus Micrarchaeota archaeon]
MITSLELENWKSHSRSIFHFKKGTNIIVGKMGSGKSSVLDAMCFALYGTFPKLSRRDQGLESLPRIGSGSDFARVALEFEKGGKLYRVERKAGKGSSDAEARCEGKLVQKGAKATTEYVSSILGVDYELFTRAIYSEQNKIDYLLSLNPRARKQEIDWLLGLGEFDEAREAAQATSTKLSEMAEFFYSGAQPEKMAEIRKRIGELESQKEERRTSADKLKESISGLKSSLEACLCEVEKFEKVRSAHQKAQMEVQRLAGVLERLESECKGKARPQREEVEKKREENEKSQRELASKKDELRKLQEAFSQVMGRVAAAEGRLKFSQEAQKKKAELSLKLKEKTGGKMVETLERELNDEKSELESLLDLQSALKAQQEELKKSVDALKESGARCPVCDSDLSGGKSEELIEKKKARMQESALLLKKQEEDTAAKKKRVAQLERNLLEAKALQAELERLESTIKETRALESELADLSKEKDACGLALKEAEAKLDEIEKMRESARAAYEEVSRLAQVFDQYEEAKQNLASAKERLASIQFDEGAYERSKAKEKSLRIELAKAESLLEGEKRQIELLGKMAESEQRALGEMAKKEDLAKKYSEAAASMTIYKNSLTAAQKEMRNLLVEEINAALSELWPALYPYGDYEAVRLEADEKDYRFVMEKMGRSFEADSVASGGERACLCLALRIAFATVLTPDVSWLILDEPTHNLDADATMMLAEAINDKIPAVVEQTFVITHDSLLAENGGGALFRLDRNKLRHESTSVLY